MMGRDDRDWFTIGIVSSLCIFMLVAFYAAYSINKHANSYCASIKAVHVNIGRGDFCEMPDGSLRSIK